MADPKTYEAAQSVAFLIGIYEGLLPFVCGSFGWHPLLAFPARLPNPWWSIVSGLVVVFTL